MAPIHEMTEQVLRPNQRIRKRLLRLSPNIFANIKGLFQITPLDTVRRPHGTRRQLVKHTTCFLGSRVSVPIETQPWFLPPPVLLMTQRLLTSVLAEKSCLEIANMASASSCNRSIALCFTNMKPLSLAAPRISSAALGDQRSITGICGVLLTICWSTMVTNQGANQLVGKVDCSIFGKYSLVPQRHDEPQDYLPVMKEPRFNTMCYVGLAHSASSIGDPTRKL